MPSTYIYLKRGLRKTETNLNKNDIINILKLGVNTCLPVIINIESLST